MRLFFNLLIFFTLNCWSILFRPSFSSKERFKLNFSNPPQFSKMVVSERAEISYRVWFTLKRVRDRKKKIQSNIPYRQALTT